MTDYSQTGEQDAILKCFEYTRLDGKHMPFSARGYDDCQWCGKLRSDWTADEICSGSTPGRFVDIGAWHAEQFSNTRALWELGWSGIFIEPSPGPLKGLVKEYGLSDRAIVIGAAVTPNGGMVELQVTDDAVSASPQSASARVWSEAGGYYGKLLVPSISVAELFERFGGDFAMASIDTEGTSTELFVAMLATGVRPRCVVVEHDNRIVELAQHAQAANYRQVLLNGNNVVYQWQSGL